MFENKSFGFRMPDIEMQFVSSIAILTKLISVIFNWPIEDFSCVYFPVETIKTGRRRRKTQEQLPAQRELLMNHRIYQNESTNDMLSLFNVYNKP